MKKIIASLLICSLCFVFVSCGEEPWEEPVDANKEIEEVQKENNLPSSEDMFTEKDKGTEYDTTETGGTTITLAGNTASIVGGGATWENGKVTMTSLIMGSGSSMGGGGGGFPTRPGGR